MFKDQFACDDFWDSPPVDSAPMDQWEEADSMGMNPEDPKVPIRKKSP